MGKKKGPEVGSATVRTLNQLIQDINIIYTECGGKDADPAEDASKLDEFQRTKKELAETMKLIKADMRTQKGIEERVGSNAESIKLKQKVNKNMEDAKRLHAKLEDAYLLDKQKFDASNSKMTSEDLTQREELVALMKQDLEYTMSESKPSTQQVSRGFQIAQQAREKRRKNREGGGNEPAPLTAKQQAFIQESIERDQILDQKLDVIKTQVMQLNEIAVDINEELDRQDVMLDEVDSKMDLIQDKLEARNKQMKEILDRSGGAQRWCPIIILFVILIALVGYIYQVLTK